MNKLLFDELSKCNNVNIKIDENHNTVSISKIKQVDVFSNAYYILELDDSLLIRNGSVLETNWNNNIIPKSKFLIVKTKNYNSNMYCFYARGFDKKNNCYLDDIYDNLWLPKNKIKVIGELN